MAQSTFKGPLKVGTIKENTGVNLGQVVLSQSTTIAQNSTAVVTSTIVVPANSRLLDLMCDVGTAFNSATSAVLSIGSAAAGTQYAGSIDVKTATGRIAPACTGAQLLAMANVGANTTIHATVTPTGATTAGYVRVTVTYVQV